MVEQGVGREEGEEKEEEEVEPPTPTTAIRRQTAEWKRPWRRRRGPSRPVSRRLSFETDLDASRVKLGARFAARASGRRNGEEILEKS